MMSKSGMPLKPTRKAQEDQTPFDQWWDKYGYWSLFGDASRVLAEEAWNAAVKAYLIHKYKSLDKKNI